eukprot:4481124-Amphidinium_carterae.1
MGSTRSFARNARVGNLIVFFEHPLILVYIHATNVLRGHLGPDAETSEVLGQEATLFTGQSDGDPTDSAARNRGRSASEGSSI